MKSDQGCLRRDEVIGINGDLNMCTYERWVSSEVEVMGGGGGWKWVASLSS